ncbi:MAG: solute:sodium symporter family transporter, partial [Pseudomonadota bacterium]
VLFVVEVGIMLLIGKLRPLDQAWSYERRDLVDLTPWRFAYPVAFTLLSAVVFLYLLFSPVGLVGGISTLFWTLLGLLALTNIAVWMFGRRMAAA